MSTSTAERRAAIAEMTALGETLRVSDLSGRFNVSTMTIRRDLEHLSERGVIERTHGGATALVARPTFESRAQDFAAEKRRIASATARLIEAGESVFVDLGTTTHYVSRALTNHTDLMVVTNSLSAASTLAGSTTNRVLLLGGFVTGGEHSTVGGHTVQMMEELHLDTAVLGVGGITIDRGLTYYRVDEVHLRRAVLDSASRVIMVADHTKFGLQRLSTLAPLTSIDVVVTDKQPLDEYRHALDKANVELVVAEPN